MTSTQILYKTSTKTFSQHFLNRLVAAFRHHLKACNTTAKTCTFDKSCSCYKKYSVDVVALKKLLQSL